MRKAFVVFLSVCCGAAQAEPMAALFGLWESPDGQARQQFDQDFSGLITTKMWFKIGENWKPVGRGILYSRPGSPEWAGVTRTSDMGGIELFESRITPREDGRFSVENESFDAQGTLMKTAEDWTITRDGRFDYTVYKVAADGSRTPWMQGRWLRIPDAGQ